MKFSFYDFTDEKIRSNVMCKSNLDPNDEIVPTLDTSVRCVLGDFSSAWNKFTDESLYTGGPSRAEQTDEYAPPESFFDVESPWLLSPAFDSWSIGIVALELLLGTPNVFTGKFMLTWQSLNKFSSIFYSVAVSIL